MNFGSFKHIFLFFIVLLLSFSFVSAYCYGGVLLNIDKIERTPGDSKFRVLAVAQPGGGECINIIWSKEDLTEALQESSPDEKVANAVLGDIVINSQSQTFHTYSRGDTVISAYSKKADGDCTIAYYYDLITKMCIEPVYGTFLNFDGIYDRDFKATFDIDNLGSSVLTTTQRSDEINQNLMGIDVGNKNKVFIQWRGDLLGGHGVVTPGYNAITTPTVNLIESDYSELGLDNIKFYTYYSGLGCEGKI